MSAKTPRSPTRAVRVLSVDDEPLLRLGLRQALASVAGLELVGEASTASEAISRIEKTSPDVVITGIDLRGRSGLDLAREIRTRFRKVRVLFLSHLDPRLYAHRAIEAGGAGYVSKTEDVRALIEAIRTVAAGETRISGPAKSSPGQSKEASTALATLSGREFEVFRLIGTGCNSTEIARRLHISRKTVEAHREHLKKKLALRSATALNLFAIRWVATA